MNNDGFCFVAICTNLDRRMSCGLIDGFIQFILSFITDSHAIIAINI